MTFPSLKFDPIAADAAADFESQRQLVRHQSRVEDLLRDAALPKRHTEPCDLDEVQARTLGRITASMGKGAVWALVGERGIGKTQVVVAVARHVCWNEHRAFYTRAQTVFYSIRAAMNDKNGAGELGVIGRHTAPELLIIDEAHERGETPFEDRTLVHIVDTRYAEMKDTIIIANLTAQEFQTSIGKSILDRIREDGGIIECTAANGWKNYRRGAK